MRDRPENKPSPPKPGKPDHDLPDKPGRPSHLPADDPSRPRPDHELPETGQPGQPSRPPRPDHTLPGDMPHPDNTLPGDLPPGAEPKGDFKPMQPIMLLRRGPKGMMEITEPEWTETHIPNTTSDENALSSAIHYTRKFDQRVVMVEPAPVVEPVEPLVEV
jgi:hypothetical protein